MSERCDGLVQVLLCDTLRAIRQLTGELTSQSKSMEKTTPCRCLTKTPSSQKHGEAATNTAMIVAVGTTDGGWRLNSDQPPGRSWDGSEHKGLRPSRVL
jgi:hypothetical protein